MSNINIHKCFKICDCDMDGPGVFGLPDGSITNDEQLAKEKGAEWGSCSCSKCGQIAYLKDGGY